MKLAKLLGAWVQIQQDAVQGHQDHGLLHGVILDPGRSDVPKGERVAFHYEEVERDKDGTCYVKAQDLIAVLEFSKVELEAEKTGRELAASVKAEQAEIQRKRDDEQAKREEADRKRIARQN